MCVQKSHAYQYSYFHTYGICRWYLCCWPNVCIQCNLLCIKSYQNDYYNFHVLHASTMKFHKIDNVWQLS